MAKETKDILYRIDVTFIHPTTGQESQSITLYSLRLTAAKALRETILQRNKNIIELFLSKVYTDDLKKPDTLIRMIPTEDGHFFMRVKSVDKPFIINMEDFEAGLANLTEEK